MSPISGPPEAMEIGEERGIRPPSEFTRCKRHRTHLRVSRRETDALTGRTLDWNDSLLAASPGAKGPCVYAKYLLI